MADAGFFRGTNSEQDTRFSDKQKKLLKTMKFADVLSEKVDMKKVKLETIKPWIAQRVTEMLGLEDEVVVEYVFTQLEGKIVDPKQMQINLTGFLNGKNAREFMRELWEYIISAQNNPTGIPEEFIEAKKKELRDREVEQDKVNAAIRKTKESIDMMNPPSREAINIANSVADHRTGRPSPNRQRRSPERRRSPVRTFRRSRTPPRNFRTRSPPRNFRRSPSPRRPNYKRSPPPRNNARRSRSRGRSTENSPKVVRPRETVKEPAPAAPPRLADVKPKRARSDSSSSSSSSAPADRRPLPPVKAPSSDRSSSRSSSTSHGNHAVKKQIPVDKKRSPLRKRDNRSSSPESAKAARAQKPGSPTRKTKAPSASPEARPKKKFSSSPSPPRKLAEKLPVRPIQRKRSGSSEKIKRTGSRSPVPAVKRKSISRSPARPGGPSVAEQKTGKPNYKKRERSSSDSPPRMARRRDSPSPARPGPAKTNDGRLSPKRIRNRSTSSSDGGKKRSRSPRRKKSLSRSPNRKRSDSRSPRRPVYRDRNRPNEYRRRWSPNPRFRQGRFDQERDRRDQRMRGNVQRQYSRRSRSASPPSRKPYRDAGADDDKPIIKLAARGRSGSPVPRRDDVPGSLGKVRDGEKSEMNPASAQKGVDAQPRFADRKRERSRSSTPRGRWVERSADKLPDKGSATKTSGDAPVIKSSVRTSPVSSGKGAKQNIPTGPKADSHTQPVKKDHPSALPDRKSASSDEAPRAWRSRSPVEARQKAGSGIKRKGSPVVSKGESDESDAESDSPKKPKKEKKRKHKDKKHKKHKKHRKDKKSRKTGGSAEPEDIEEKLRARALASLKKEQEREHS